MAPAPSLTTQIGYAETENARCRGVYPTMVRGGVMAQSAMDAELSIQAAIIGSLRRLELFLMLADFGHVVPVEFIEAIARRRTWTRCGRSWRPPRRSRGATPVAELAPDSLQPAPVVARNSVALSVADIEVGPRLRATDDDWAEAIAVSIERDGGLIHPIEVRPLPGGRHRLVVGGHRLRAYQMRGWPRIEAVLFTGDALAARAREIAENVIRRTLSPYDRAAFVAELYEVERARAGLDADAPNNAVGARARWASDASDMMSDAYQLQEQVAAKVGLSSRTLRRDLELFSACLQRCATRCAAIRPARTPRRCACSPASRTRCRSRGSCGRANAQLSPRRWSGSRHRPRSTAPPSTSTRRLEPSAACPRAISVASCASCRATSCCRPASGSALIGRPADVGPAVAQLLGRDPALVEAGKPALQGFSEGLSASAVDRAAARARYSARIDCIRFLQAEGFLDTAQALTPAGERLLAARRGARRV